MRSGAHAAIEKKNSVVKKSQLSLRFKFLFPLMSITVSHVLSFSKHHVEINHNFIMS